MTESVLVVCRPSKELLAEISRAAPAEWGEPRFVPIKIGEPEFLWTDGVDVLRETFRRDPALWAPRLFERLQRQVGERRPLGWRLTEPYMIAWDAYFVRIDAWGEE